MSSIERVCAEYAGWLRDFLPAGYLEDPGRFRFDEELRRRYQQEACEAGWLVPQWPRGLGGRDLGPLEAVAVRVQAAAPFATLPSLVKQAVLDITAGAKTSAAFNGQTKYIRVVCEAQCAISGTGLVATVNDVLLPALRPEYFGVQGGKTISVILAP